MVQKLLNKRHLVIATMHKKERVIAPIIQDAFQVFCSVPELNTDLLGTFSGEVKRRDSALKTARKKCALAMSQSNVDLAISSEGSFGPHLTIPFANANEEIVLLLDRKHGLEVIGKHLTHETNFNGKLVESIEEAMEFTQNVGFPSHAVIIRESESTSDIIAKGITDSHTLLGLLSSHFEHQKTVWIETDMRALFNPTRMKAIEKATLHLIEKLKSACPKCSMPGFWATDYRTGLPCSLCHSPTQSTLASIWTCSACGYTEERTFPHQKYEEDPMYCDVCNP